MTPVEKSELLFAAQTRYLNKVAPGYTTKTVRWTGGNTQIIEYGKGTPMLLLHGGMGEALQWAPIMPLLGERYHLYAVDRPGHGMADPFTYNNSSFLSDATVFIKEILQTLQLNKVTLTGCSMGGLWATAFTLQYPEQVSHLFLVGSPAGITRQLPFMLRAGTLPGLRRLIRSMMLKPTTRSTLSFWKQLLVANPGMLDEDLLIALTASQARNAPNWFTLIDSVFDFRGMKKNLVLGDKWNDLSVPVTFIWGDKDAWAPVSLGEALVAGNPHYKMITIPNAGHAPWIDSPQLVTNAILS
jgi:pimeloyl-ACP methyl ester carboxylesterase